MIESLKALFVRDLGRLKDEIAAFKNEENIWKIAGEIKNPAGNLCLHLLGNINHFIGNILLNSGYARDRDAEFNQKNVPQEKLVAMVKETIHLFEENFSTIKPSTLQQTYPLEPFGYSMTTEFFLIHLLGHLNYHLGQVNYHRRLLDD